jgi:hypothetical protein
VALDEKKQYFDGSASQRDTAVALEQKPLRREEPERTELNRGIGAVAMFFVQGHPELPSFAAIAAMRMARL